MVHVPVLLYEVLHYLDPKPGEFIIDGTVNGGGHTNSILKKMMPRGKYLALDLDEHLLNNTKAKIEDKFRIPNSKFEIIWQNRNYADITDILKKNKLGKADGLLIDLGFSSEQLEMSGRGFSFAKDEPLDMRYNLGASLSAYEVVNNYNEKELSDIFWKFGEECYSRRIAHSIVEMRKQKPLRTTTHLAEAVRRSAPRSYEHRIHPATRIFQALRIYVNNELGNLERLLKKLPLILKRDGRVVIISFHSLEDRIVKNYFREIKKSGEAEILTKKPITATEEEIRNNPRSRSAKLRVIQMT